MKHKNVQEATDLIDVAFDEGFETFGKLVKATKHLDSILDGQPGINFGKDAISTTGRPYDHPKKIRVRADVEECGMMDGEYDGQDSEMSDIEPIDTEEEYEDDYEAMPNDGPNDIDHVPNQNANALYKSIISQLGEWKRLNEGGREEYKALFNGMLKKFGVSNPSQLDDAKKKAFFNAVDKAWKSKKEKA